MSTVDELKGLKELLDSGALTQEEFDAEKKKILSEPRQEPQPTQGATAVPALAEIPASQPVDLPETPEGIVCPKCGAATSPYP